MSLSNAEIITFLLDLVLVVSGALIIALIIYKFVYKRYVRSLDLRLLMVRVTRTDLPQGEGVTKERLFSEINLTEQLFSALTSIGKPFTLEVSVHHAAESINFYVAVPRASVDFVARQIQGIFPGSQVKEVDDYTIFGPGIQSASAYLMLKEHYALPLRTYHESEADTFAPLVSTLSKLDEVGEGASIQLVVNPEKSDSPKKSVLSAIDRLKKGDKLSDVLRTALFKAKDVAKFVMPDKKKEGESKPVDDLAVQALQSKIAKPLFSVNVRVVSAAQTKDRAEDIVLAIAGAFSQLAAPVRNQFSVVRPKNQKEVAYAYSFREFDRDQAMVLNIEELASIYHLPTLTTDVPRIQWVKTHEAPPPENLPAEGVLLGESLFRGDKKGVRLTDNDRRRHLYIIGQTGTGKSILLLNQMVSDMKAGKGLCVIDPHGDLVDKVLERVPKERIDDVIVFDPGDVRRPLGINMLEFNPDRPEEKTFIVNEIQSIFNRLFSEESMGPQFQQYMRYSLLLLMEDSKNEPATLMEVSRIFTDEQFRKRKLARISNPAVIDFWEKEAAKTSGEQGLANMTPYITSKFGNFVANDYMRPIIGQTKSAFNFRDVMDNQKILLVNLSKGKIGDINSSLLGMIITGRLLLAALSRVDMEEADRKDFYLYIDEFQNYTTDSIAVILSEARKYRLCLNLAHQFIGQLTDEIRNAVFGNVGSMAAFRVGPEDTEFLMKQFSPEFTEKDLISIENYNAFVKLLIQGQPTRPFNIKTVAPSPGSVEVREKLKELSRLTYGRDIGEIEQEILGRLRK